MVGDTHTQGSLEVSTRWRALVPALSSDPKEDLTGIANDYERVHEIAERFRPEFNRLVPGGVGFGITGLSVWSPWNGEELSGARRELGLVLSVGILSVLSAWKVRDDDGAREARDRALFVGVPHESHLPGGPLFIEGVPLVIWILRPGSLRPLSTDIAPGMDEDPAGKGSEQGVLPAEDAPESRVGTQSGSWAQSLTGYAVGVDLVAVLPVSFSCALTG